MLFKAMLVKASSTSVRIFKRTRISKKTVRDPDLYLKLIGSLLQTY